MSAATFCWQCGRKLEHVNGRLVFAELDVIGATVRVHLACAPYARLMLSNRHVWPEVRHRAPSDDPAPR